MLVSEIISITFKISHSVVTCLHKALLGIMSKKNEKRFYYYRVGQKWTIFESWYFAMANGRKACDMSKVSEFCVEKLQLAC